MCHISNVAVEASLRLYGIFIGSDGSMYYYITECTEYIAILHGRTARLYFSSRAEEWRPIVDFRSQPHLLFLPRNDLFFKFAVLPL